MSSSVTPIPLSILYSAGQPGNGAARNTYFGLVFALLMFESV